MARWTEIADQLRADIRSGKFAAGSQLPTEENLARQMRTSRQTVRKVLALLASEDLIRSRQGSGTFVRQPPVPLTVSRYSPHDGLGPWESACALAGVSGEVEMVGVVTEPADAMVAGRLGLPVGTPVVRRTRRMIADGVVRQLQTAWIEADRVAGTVLAGEAKVVGGVYAALRQLGYDVDRSSDSVVARMPTPDEREQLGLATGTPVMEQLRVTYLADVTPIEVLLAVSIDVVYIYVQEVR